jgi:hypothetical protein
MLTACNLEALPDFTCFEKTLRKPGPWIAGIDFPFGQSRKFVETIGWPRDWEAYVLHVESLGRDGFRKALMAYSSGRAIGDKEHRRETDIAAGSISPQKLFGVPVGLMFHEGAPRLIRADVTIPHIREGDPGRIVVEAYPGVLARFLIGRRSYKNDNKKKQTVEQLGARRDLLNSLASQEFAVTLGFSVHAIETLADDPTRDNVDALLCAVQAAWSWMRRQDDYGANIPVDPLEGWIADPTLWAKSTWVAP